MHLRIRLCIFVISKTDKQTIILTTMKASQRVICYTVLCGKHVYYHFSISEKKNVINDNDFIYLEDASTITEANKRIKELTSSDALAIN